jgi:hypothetical protein
MTATVINPNDLCTSVQIRLKCTGFYKIFGKQSLIHPTFRSGPIRNSWNVVIELSNRISVISIHENEHGSFNQRLTPTRDPYYHGHTITIRYHINIFHCGISSKP